jgi:transposase-like protein
VTRNSLHGLAKQYIMPASIVYTDFLPAYEGLDKINGYRHRRINIIPLAYTYKATFTPTLSRDSGVC